MTKAIIAALLAALGLIACTASAPQAPAGDEDWLYGRHAGQPMRPAPDGGM